MRRPKSDCGADADIAVQRINAHGFRTRIDRDDLGLRLRGPHHRSVYDNQALSAIASLAGIAAAFKDLPGKTGFLVIGLTHSEAPVVGLMPMWYENQS